MTISTMLAAFILGGVPFGLLIGWARGVDLRTQGSGNVGATNAGRVAGTAAGIATLVLDVGKGVLAAGAGGALGGPRLAAGAGCAAILGHVFSPFLRFAGGKGVATAGGVFAVIAPIPLAVALAGFAAVFARWRVVSLGSLTAATLLAGVAWWVTPDPRVRGLALAAAALVWIRHRDNLVRLRSRAEPDVRG